MRPAVGAEAARRHALGRLGRTGVVDAVVAQVLGHRLAGVEPLLDPGVRDVAGHDHRAGQREAGLDRVAAQLGPDLVHRPRQVDADDVAAQLVLVDLGQEPGRVVLQLLEVDAVVGDLGEDLPVGRAGHGDRHGAGGAVAGQADHPDVVAEVLAAELGPDAEALHLGQDLGLELRVAEPVAQLAALGGQGVEVAGRGQLRGLQGELGGGPADHDGQVVGRAGGGAECPELLVEEPAQAVRVEQRLGLLEQEALVGRAAALGHEQERVGVPVDRRDLDLRGQVGPGVDLVPGGQRRHLAVAQVVALVGLEDAAGDRLLVTAPGEDELALLALDDGGAGVLAHREDAAGRDAGVLQQVERHEAVVGRGLGVVEDLPELLEVPGSQVVGDLVHGQGGEPGQHLGLDGEEPVSAGGEAADAVRVDQPVGGLVGAEREQFREGELGHRPGNVGGA